MSELTFSRCYREAIKSFRLPPDRAATQVREILEILRGKGSRKSEPKDRTAAYRRPEEEGNQ